jgi:chemotaxis protein methyltransferase CheR
VDPALQAIEVDLCLEAVQRRYGYDFRSYSRASITRRLRRRAEGEGLRTITALTERLLHDPTALDRLLLDLSVNVTSMFRDPSFFATFRAKVVPVLRTYPFIRIWNAGCATGEETYSLSILLEEAGLRERSRIYATDINERVLDAAAAGAFPLRRMRDYTDNYLKAGGTEVFSSYYTAEGDKACFRPSLVDNVVFAQHNLVSDGSFNEFHAVVCRNVMIYFDRPLQDRVLRLFADSLVPFGVLGLGQKETIRFSSLAASYEELDGRERLYRKVPAA